jgi:hypothetical protein
MLPLSVAAGAKSRLKYHITLLFNSYELPHTLYIHIWLAGQYSMPRPACSCWSVITAVVFALVRLTRQEDERIIGGTVVEGTERCTHQVSVQR